MSDTTCVAFMPPGSLRSYELQFHRGKPGPGWELHQTGILKAALARPALARARRNWPQFMWRLVRIEVVG